MTTNRSEPTYLHPGMIYAIREIRQYCQEHEDVSIRQAAEIRRCVNADTESYDYATAVSIMDASSKLAVSKVTDLRGICREVLGHCIRNENHPWTTFVTLGRRVLRKALKESNVLQCFEYGELFDSDDGTFEWWSEMELYIRIDVQRAKNFVGHEGERLSFEREVKLLASLDGFLPQWESREDSTLGYDITSYDPSFSPPRPILIDAKACRTKPLSFYISPNEWKVAESRPDSYFFHLWDLSGGDGHEKLYIITPAMLAPHVPFNRGVGEWKSAQVFWPPKSNGNILKDIRYRAIEKPI